jgi:hypothetical protein
MRDYVRVRQAQIAVEAAVGGRLRNGIKTKRLMFVLPVSHCRKLLWSVASKRPRSWVTSQSVHFFIIDGRSGKVP